MDNGTKPAELKTGDRFRLDGADEMGAFAVLGVKECELSGPRTEPHNAYQVNVMDEPDWVCAYDVHPA